jgi:hypothetical protein
MNAHRLAATATLVATISAAGLADASHASQESENLTPEAAERQFTACGYEVIPSGRVSDHPATLLPRFTPIEHPDTAALFVVRDAGETTREDGRSLTAVVFPTLAEAEHVFQDGARLMRVADQVQRLESGHGVDTGPPPLPVDTDLGPPLFLGHGLTVWRRNVALTQLITPPVTAVRATADELERRGLDAASASRSEFTGAAQRALAATKPRSAESTRSPVDRDFVRCLGGQ